MSQKSALSHLECAWCNETYESEQLINTCPACGKPLLARYDINQAKDSITPNSLADRAPNLWRYAEMLPVHDPACRLTLGEGFTPLLKLDNLGENLGLVNLFAKEEGLNPTASFKARGLCMAVSRAAELGAQAVAIPTAGNAGSAMAAYAAQAKLPAHIFVPQDVPAPFLAEYRALGAEITLVDGLIGDCAKFVQAGVKEGRWFDVSTLKEPYRVEGKKTMGYELAEQFSWELPDAIIYPTGGGTGIVGMWKAFDEMEKLGWIGSKRPRMISVQSAGCAPMVRAFEQGTRTAEPWQNADTIADGLRVPGAIGDFLILDAVRDSGGTALAVTDEEIKQAMLDLGKAEGIFAAPEAAATVAALHHLTAQEAISVDDRVVLFLTGNGLKYHHLLA